MKKKEILILLLALITVAVACKKESELEKVRFFRPVSAAALVADSNAILVSWLKIQGVESYTVQVSRDTFTTIDKSVNVQDTSSTLVVDLQWDKLYQDTQVSNHPKDADGGRYIGNRGKGKLDDQRVAGKLNQDPESIR